MDDKKIEIGTRLAQIRDAHKLSQEDLGNKIGLSQKTISSWEKDRTFPKMQELLKLCKIYDCTFDYLTGVKQYDSNDITIEDIMFRLSTLDVNTLMKIQDHIQMLIRQHKEIEKIAVEKQRIEKEKILLEEKLKEYNQILETMKVPGIRRE